MAEIRSKPKPPRWTIPADKAKRMAADIAHSLLCDLIAHDYPDADECPVGRELRRIARDLKRQGER